MRASKIAAMPAVREALLQRRDMGTTVFPLAPLKIFLTASAEQRAQRRYKQLKEKGINASIASLVADMKARDEQDANRAVSPLKPAEDAIVLDTTHMSIQVATQKVLELAEQNLQELP